MTTTPAPNAGTVRDVPPRAPAPLARPRRLTAVALALSLALLAVACSSDGDAPGDEGASATTSTLLPPPAGLDRFYSVPDPLPAGRPGDLLTYQQVQVPQLPGTQWRVMYLSESVRGDPIVVTGVVLVPPGDAPPEGRPVVSWAHGTAGIADLCAPSIDIATQAPFAAPLLARGWVVVATDYEGLGTPGRHPYLVGESEGRGVLDIVKAAQELPDSGAGDRYAVWGHSQGGHAALFAGEQASEWAPDLELVGVVAGAPPSQLLELDEALQQTPFKHYVAMSVVGLNAGYGDADAPLDAVLDADGIEWLSRVDEMCSTNLGVAAASVDFDAFETADPADVPAWRTLIEANDPGRFSQPFDAPLLIIHGDEDEQVPVGSSAELLAHLCAIGQEAQRWEYPGANHTSVVLRSVGDMLTWISDRFAGEPAPGALVPSGSPAPLTQSCP